MVERGSRVKLIARVLEWWLGVPWPGRVAAALAWAVLIWWASSRPARAASGPVWPLLHNAMHLGVYATLGVLVLCAAWGRKPAGLMSAQRRPEGAAWRTVVACGLATAYGAIDEVHQSFVPGRVASFGDLATDAAGVVLGVSCALWLRRREPGTLRIAISAMAAGVLSVCLETIFNR